jgi:hypothetical protein
MATILRGSAARENRAPSRFSLRAPVVGDIVICSFHDNGVRWVLVGKSAGRTPERFRIVVVLSLLRG